MGVDLCGDHADSSQILMSRDAVSTRTLFAGRSLRGLVTILLIAILPR
jgi:hypothetical protein